MHRLPNKLSLLTLLLVLVPAMLTMADERSDRERTTRIESLIEVLASKNRAPQIHGNARRGEDQTISFPKEFDTSLQVPVYLAVKELLAEDEAAMDLLLAHEGDARYSFSLNSDTDNNITVSQACEWIARKKLVAYEPELHVITGSQLWIYPSEQDVPFKTWWSKNRERGLATLQVEAIDVAMKFMVSVDGKTALPWHPEARRLPLEDFNRYRDANLKTLRAIREFIVETGSPYRARTLEDRYRCFYGLPWSGRRHNK